MKKTMFNAAMLLVAVPVLLTACSWAENQLKLDRENNLEIQDVRDGLGPREIPAPENTAASDVPDFEDYMNTSAANLQPMPMVSVSINQNVSVRDALYELAQQANYDIELDPNIQGGIIFSARNRPFDQVMERICALAGLRYKLEDNVVRVEVDTPYSKNYKIDYLMAARKVSNSVQNNSTVQSEGENGGSSGGSTFSIDSSTDIDFWKDLEDNIKQIMVSNAAMKMLKSSSTPAVTIPAAVVAPVADDASGAGPDGVSPPAAPAPVPAAPPAQIVDSGVPTTEEALEPTYSINKQAGVISVFANDRVHRKIGEYLDIVRRSVLSQVLIEAKVVEVSLLDQYATGINWNALDLPLKEVGVSYNSNTMPTLANTDLAALSGGVTFTYAGNDLSTLIKAVSGFGTVHALASPRLTVLNNQSAVLNVSVNEVYFDVETTDPVLDSNGNVTTPGKSDATPKTVPDGILVNVTPSIDLESGETTISVRPTITKIVKYANDPTNANNKIPVTSVQEFDSVIRLKSGEVAVLGGLLKDRGEANQGGIPGASEVPILGGLFRSQKDSISKSELVVLLRATILDSAGKSVHQADRDLYKTFSKDRRPFPM